MRILILSLILLFTSTNTNNVDLGAPEIQAVCRVTLNDGQTIEGFITFGIGGYVSNYRNHGFCLLHEDGSKQLILYNFSFNLTNLNSYESYRNGTASLCYLENITPQASPEHKIEFDYKENILTKTTSTKDIEKYKVMDQMVMYKEIPSNLSLRYMDEAKSSITTIEVNKINSIELLKKPSQNSLQIIEKARENQRIAEAKDEYWVDYQPPVWYHEVITDKQQMEYLAKFF